MILRILIVLLVCCCIDESSAADSYTLYLVRHAEKEPDGSRDPVLTDIGKQRSDNLANWFSDKQIEDIWSSDYKRTRDTAKPIVSKLDIDLTLYDAGNLPELTENLVKKQHTAIIVGHSNTTPQLARLLCDCEIKDMDDSEHDRVIVISVVNGETRVKTIQQR